MKCSVEGCERNFSYKALQLCQKHYFRIRRNGHLDLLDKNPKNRYVTPNGYISLRIPDHPLANRAGLVFEHRYVIYPSIGPDCRPCELCGKPQTWKVCHVDHKDDDRKNNEIGNLRILCRGCNVKRGFTPDSYANRGQIGLIEFDGRRDTPAEWARDPRVKVSGNTIILRKKQGMSDYDALFSPKVTHNGNPKIDRRPKKTQYKHERSNAVSLTVEGVTLSAAEWSRESGVTVTEASIINRVRAGWGEIESIFTAPRGNKPSIDDLKAIKAEYRAKVRELKKVEYEN